VERAGDQLLAGAGLAVDEHGEVRLHQPREDAVDLLHRRGATHQRHRLADVGQLFQLAGARFGERAADDADQLLQVERLGQVLVRPAFGRADRGHERVLRADHDDWQIGPALLDPRQQLERVLVRHDHVGDDEIAVTAVDPAPQGRGVAGAAHIVPGARQRLVQDSADRAVIVGDKDRPRH